MCISTHLGMEEGGFYQITHFSEANPGPASTEAAARRALKKIYMFFWIYLANVPEKTHAEV